MTRFEELKARCRQQSLDMGLQVAELDELLEQNFIKFGGRGPVSEQIHAYLATRWKELHNLPKDDPTLVAKARDRWYVPDPRKAGDLEQRREKALLKEFEEYKEVKKKLKVFRLEAVRAGLKKLVRNAITPLLLPCLKNFLLISWKKMPI